VHETTQGGRSTFLQPRARGKRPWRHGEQGRNNVERPDARGKGPKARPGPLRLRHARAGVHNCAREASLHGRARERERDGVGPRRRPGAATRGMAAQGTKKRNKATTRARWSWQRHLQENASQPGSRPASPVEAARWRSASIVFPLGSKARASIEG
jgi:hypothetical protein